MLTNDHDTMPKERSMIQMRARELMREGLTRVEETADTFGGFDASRDGFGGNNHNKGEWVDAYSRVIPNNFNESDDHPVDMFTQKVLKGYATEGVSAEGKPDGHFFITKD